MHTSAHLSNSNPNPDIYTIKYMTNPNYISDIYKSTYYITNPPSLTLIFKQVHTSMTNSNSNLTLTANTDILTSAYITNPTIQTSAYQGQGRLELDTSAYLTNSNPNPDIYTYI